MARYNPKDLGEVFDGKWVLVYAESYHRPSGRRTAEYTLENAFNHYRVTLTESAFFRVKNGESSISKLLTHYFWQRLKSNPKYARARFLRDNGQTAIVDYRKGDGDGKE